MASDESELELISQARAGNQLAIQRLLMIHHDALVGILEQKIPADLRGVLAAEDVCQEAYVAAIRELGSFQPQGKHSFFGWLLVIAERKLIDAIRAMRAVKRGGGKRAVDLPAGSAASSMVTLLEQVAIHVRTPSRSAAGHELALAVQKALAGLKEDYRTALRYRYIEGLSVADTAQRMGRSEGAVLKLCYRGLQRLSEAIGNASRFFSRKP